jgi:hypothetical protein
MGFYPLLETMNDISASPGLQLPVEPKGSLITTKFDCTEQSEPVVVMPPVVELRVQEPSTRVILVGTLTVILELVKILEVGMKVYLY